MELLNRRSVLKPAFAIACGLLPGPASAATSKSEFTTADDAGLPVDSTVIMGEKSDALVDARLTGGNAERVADMLQSGLDARKHSDYPYPPKHILDLPVFLDRFPQAKAHSQTDIEGILSQIFAGMRRQIAGAAPAVAFSDHIMLEGKRIEILPLMAGDTALITPVHIPGHRKSDSPNDGTVFDAKIADLDHCKMVHAVSADAEKFRAKQLVGTENPGFAFAMDAGVATAFPG